MKKSTNEEILVEHEYLMLDPMWLADLMKTIVTVRHAYCSEWFDSTKSNY